MKPESLCNKRISLYYLAGCKPYRNTLTFCMILDHAHYRMYRTVQSSSVIILIAEILASRSFTIFSDMNGMSYKLIYTLSLCSRYGNNRNFNELLKQIDLNSASVARHLIHHIQCDDHGNIKFKKLHR